MAGKISNELVIHQSYQSTTDDSIILQEMSDKYGISPTYFYRNGYKYVAVAETYHYNPKGETMHVYRHYKLVGKE